jgi:hypothetical protein
MSFLPRILGAAFLIGSIANAQISFHAQTTYPLQGFQPDWVVTGDFDGTNGPDFAVSTGAPSGQNGPDFVEIFDNTGNGSFLAGQVVPLGQNVGAAAIVAADLDGDGDPDMAVALKNTNMVQILLNGAGTFSMGGSFAVNGLEARHMAGGDFDADGDVDLVTSNRASGSLSLLRNNGSAGFTLIATITVGVGPRHVALDDLNGDCSLDIAVAVHDDRQIKVLFNNGNGTFGAPVAFNVPGNEKPSGMTMADLDHDGDVDLVSTTDVNNSGRIIVMVNDGLGGFQSVLYQTSSQNPDAVLTADFDADGDKDVATADEASNLVSALANSGGATYGAAVTFMVGLHPSMIATEDFDQNGSSDVVTSNKDSDNVSVLLNAGVGGTQNFCETSPNSIGAGARIDTYGSLSIAANDFKVTGRCAAPNQPALFFYGGGKKFLPFGNGNLCVSKPFFRLNPPVQIDASGHVLRRIDFTQPPTGGGPGQVTSGSTWYFQLWYRDPMGGGARYNTTDALSATFNP